MSSYSHPLYILYGIVPFGHVEWREQYPLVKASCHYNIEDVYSVAELVQEYYSNAPVDRQVEYVFPLPPDAAVCAFKAVIDDKKVIKGIVKEKEEAKKEYKEAVAAGKTAGLLEKEAADVFRVSLGNLKPKSKVAVHISYVSIIGHDASTPEQLRLTMPTIIAPRYGTPPASLPIWGPNRGNTMELSVSVHMTQPITAVSSPTHPVAMTLGSPAKELTGDFQPSKAYVYLHESSTFLEKDVVILISSQKLDHPRCSVERYLSSEGAEDTTDAYALTLVPQFNLPPLPGQEYVFLVDRSGSMSGSRITQVKAALQIMLKSLPSKNTSFNIVSFGSHHNSLWNASRTYSAETVAEASKHVDAMEANYGGTEIRSALDYAFKKKTKEQIDGKPTPVAVFVLTDGEAWDLDNVIATVSQAAAQAQKEYSLLRTFVLGVGDDVSTSMCDGIARAGKGVAVYVANNEKPDAKLMSLLRAARGGVIEDLNVDWGVQDPPSKKEGYSLDDDFEMISDETASIKTAVEPPAPAPISLFDTSTPSTSEDLGPKKMIINLAPPPRIQQAPKSDKLPIPLYPGFRCSIFSIIKVSGQTSFSSCVRINGKVMGSPVTLEIPVTPITLEGGAATHLTDVNVKLLHSLAARALIQDWEDKEKTEMNRAEIERLGKRYSLASSATSFLAIDDETKSEMEKEEVHYQVHEHQERERERVDARRRVRSAHGAIHIASAAASFRPSGAMFGSLGGLGASNQAGRSLPPPAPTGMLRLMSHPAAPLPPPPRARGAGASVLASYEGGEQDESYSTRRSHTVSARADSSPTQMSGEEYGSASLSQMAYEPTQMAFGAAQLQPSVGGGGPKGGGFFKKLVSRSSAAPAPAPAPAPASSPFSAPAPMQMGGLMGSYSDSTRSADRAGYSLGGGAPAPASYGGTLTVESIARAQQFDGSFPVSSDIIRLLTGASSTPALPGELAVLSGSEQAKQIIWVTVLVLAALAKKFAKDKDSWEMLAEKSSEFVETSLVSMGVDRRNVVTVTNQLKTAAARNV